MLTLFDSYPGALELAPGAASGRRSGIGLVSRARRRRAGQREARGVHRGDAQLNAHRRTQLSVRSSSPITCASTYRWARARQTTIASRKRSRHETGPGANLEIAEDRRDHGPVARREELDPHLRETMASHDAEWRGTVGPLGPGAADRDHSEWSPLLAATVEAQAAQRARHRGQSRRPRR